MRNNGSYSGILDKESSHSLLLSACKMQMFKPWPLYVRASFITSFIAMLFG